MRARIKLRLGNMFDGPSDLIVLPCNTQGGVTGFVADHLRHFLIPAPKSALQFGDVEIIPFTGGENIAQYVAYAASVEYSDSTPPSAIERIGKQLGNATCTYDSIKVIAAPLLGAGAGGLSSEDSVMSLHKGFLETAMPDATLTISVLHKNVFERLISNLGRHIPPEDAATTKQISAREQKHPRVFISYTHTNAKHQQWVEALAVYLRENGVDARIDIWHLRHGMDLPQWMCNELQLADRVVIVSDESYAQKANGRHGGVGWETMVIQGDMANSRPETTKYLIIVRANDFSEGIPTYLKTKYAFHWPDFSNEIQLRQELLRELFEVVEEPPLGVPPVFI